MSQEPNESTTRIDDQDGRLPYEPPRVIGEETFETLALSCGKGPDLMSIDCSQLGTVS